MMKRLRRNFEYVKPLLIMTMWLAGLVGLASLLGNVPDWIGLPALVAYVLAASWVNYRYFEGRFDK